MKSVFTALRGLFFKYAQSRKISRDRAMLREYVKRAEEDDQFRNLIALGLTYTEDQEVERDLAQTAHWYLKAAEQGFAKAQHSLGLMLLRW